MKFHPSLVYTHTDSALGSMVLAATDLGLAGVWFDGQRHQPDMGAWRLDAHHPDRAARVMSLIFIRPRRGANWRWRSTPSNRWSACRNGFKRK